MTDRYGKAVQNDEGEVLIAHVTNEGSADATLYWGPKNDETGKRLSREIIAPGQTKALVFDTHLWAEGSDALTVQASPWAGIIGRGSVQAP